MKLRVTHLDLWRRFTGADSDMTEAQFRALIRGKTPPSDAAAAGTAFHKWMEEIVKTATPRARYASPPEDPILGWRFKFATMGELGRVAPGHALYDTDFVQMTLPMLGARTEVEASREIAKGITLVGHADVVSAGGEQIWDYKTTNSAIDLTRYTDSYQWRAYLDLFGAAMFTYEVFELSKPRGKDERLRHVIDHERINIPSYPGMRSDVEDTALELADYCRRARIFEGA